MYSEDRQIGSPRAPDDSDAVFQRGLASHQVGQGTIIETSAKTEQQSLSTRFKKTNGHERPSDVQVWFEVMFAGTTQFFKVTRWVI